MAWHYLKDGKIIGPLTELRFARLRPSLDPTTQVWKDGMKEWQALSSVPLTPPKRARKAAMPRPEAVAPARPVAFGGFGRRLAAWIVDKAIFWTAISLLFHPSSFSWASGSGAWVGAWNSVDNSLFDLTLENAARTMIFIVYETAMVKEFGATLGKMVFGLKVLHDGEKLGYARSLARVFAKYLSGIVLGLGYLMVLWDQEKRGLHDYLCETRVVKG